jgi:hypothetical protein
MFSSEDLPTFERPMKANSGSDSSGHDSKSGALQSKMADEIFTMENHSPLSHKSTVLIPVLSEKRLFNPSC